VNTYWFFDKSTGRNLYVSADSRAEAMIKTLHMVMDGEAVHPIFVGEC